MNETELFAKYRQTRDEKLRNEIVERYFHVAEILAKKFVGRGVEYDDLLQIASLALIKGVERFDETMGVKFSTYITPTIAGEIKNYFRDRSRLVHLPRRVVELKSAARRAAEEIAAETGKQPSVGEIAQRLGVDEEELIRAVEAGSVVSLDRPAGEEENGSFYDMIPAASDDFERLEQRDEVAAALATLTGDERKMVNLRFGEELSQSETAKRMGVSQMYISRMERRVLQKLRENLKKSMA